MKTVNVALIGCGFMGKAHSHAWRTVNQFFDTGVRPVMKVVCGKKCDPVPEFAARWGWHEGSCDWREVLARKDVDVVDIVTPTFLHHDMVAAAAAAGKHILCEKPLALSTEQAAAMCDAARRAGVVHYLNHNYRRCPAVALAKRFIEEGRIGRIFHWRGAYLQSWIIDPAFPLTWHLRKETAGAGPHYDLNSHSVDLARYLVGDISAVMAMTTRFIDRRPLDASGSGGAFSASSRAAETGEVTVDDAAFMVAEFANGALGSFDSSRFAAGRKNFNSFEIYGEKGTLAFNLERMNELEYLSLADEGAAQGFRTIQATDPSHPYIDHWWPPGHIIGYEHTFTHAVADFLDAVANGSAIHPNFDDGLAVMQVLEAGLQSAATGRKVRVGESASAKAGD